MLTFCSASLRNRQESCLSDSNSSAERAKGRLHEALLAVGYKSSPSFSSPFSPGPLGDKLYYST